METAPPYDAGRPILLAAVRGLVDQARSERALLREDSAERHFYLGVEAAAQEILQPQVGSSRAEGWLDRQPQAFREGYLRAAAVLAAATADEPPRRIPLPDASSIGEPRRSAPPGS